MENSKQKHAEIKKQKSWGYYKKLDEINSIIDKKIGSRAIKASI